MVETFQHLTDVMEATDGSEARVPLRHVPRVSYEYRYPVKAFEDPSLVNALYAGLRKNWAIQVWAQAVKLGAQALTGATRVKLAKQVDLYDYYPGCLAALYISNSIWVVLEITDIDPVENELIFETPLLRGWSTAAWCMPVRVGTIRENVQKTTVGTLHKYAVIYDVADNPPIGASVPPQYKGYDLYVTPGLKTGSTVRDIVADQEDIDFELGPVFRRTQWRNSRYAYNSYMLLETPEEAHAMRQRFQRHMGRANLFWQPTFEINIRVKTINDDKVDIHADDYGYYQEHKVIAFRSYNDDVVVREVMSAEAIDATTIRLTLDQAVGISKADLFYVAYVGLCRLDSDTLEYNWIGAGKAEATLRILELYPNAPEDEET